MATNPWEMDWAGAPQTPAVDPIVKRGGPDPYQVRKDEADERRKVEDQDMQRRRFQLDEQRLTADLEKNRTEQAKIGSEQGKAGNFYLRATRSNDAYNGLGVGPEGQVRSALKAVVPENIMNANTSSERQQAEAYQRDFIAATLRYESGAAIPPDEFNNQSRIFFPQPGDSPETIKAKEMLRANAIEGLRMSAGPAADKVDASPVPSASVTDTGTGQIATTAGQNRTTSQSDDEFNQLAEAAFRNGASVEEMNALAAKYGRGAFGDDLASAISMRGRGGIVAFIPPQSGVVDVSKEQAAVGDFMTSPTGGAVAGVANGLTLGGSDELMGAANSIVTGTPLDQAIAEANLGKSIVANANPTAYGVGNLAGGLASSVLVGGAATRAGLQAGSKILSLPSLALDAGTGAVTGALENNEGRASGALTGSVAGAAGGATGRTIGKVLSPTGGASKPLYDAEVRPTPGQRLGGVVNWGEEMMGSVPFVGGVVRSARQGARDQFETGAFNNALAEIGTKLPKGIKNGSAAHRYAQARFNQAYEKARNGLEFVRDEKFSEDYQALVTEIADGGLNSESAKQFQKFITAQVDRRLKDGRMTPDAYKAAHSAIGKRIAAIRNNPSGDQEFADFLEGFGSILDDAARRNSSSEAVAALDAADRGYAQLVRIERASNMGGVEDAGRFTPKQYAGAVKRESGGRASRSKAYLRGDALGQDYAEAGLRLVDRHPNSGTPERQIAATALLGGAGYLNPATLVLPATAAAPYLPGVRAATNALLAPRSEPVARLTDPLANVLSRVSLAAPNALLFTGD